MMMRNFMLRRLGVNYKYIRRELNLNAWLSEHAQNLRPPVANKLIYGNGDLKVMAVGGPNERRDYHIQTGEEFFIQVKGELVLKIIENNRFKDIIVRPGESFLLPSFIPHSPQRSPGSIGLVFERSHTPVECDGMLWFRDEVSLNHGDHVNWNLLEYEHYFHCIDLGTQLKPIIESYNLFKKNKSNNSHLVSQKPIIPDEQVQCAPVYSFDKRIDSLFTSEILHRGDEVLCNLQVGPSTLQSSAAPFDIFVWQRRGNSRVRSSYSTNDNLITCQPGDIHFIPKGSPYEWYLDNEKDSIVTVSNMSVALYAYARVYRGQSY